MAFLQGLKAQKSSQVCSHQDKLKETALHLMCGSALEPPAAEALGAQSEFKKHLDRRKKSLRLFKKNIGPLNKKIPKSQLSDCWRVADVVG